MIMTHITHIVPWKHGHPCHPLIRSVLVYSHPCASLQSPCFDMLLVWLLADFVALRCMSGLTSCFSIIKWAETSSLRPPPPERCWRICYRFWCTIIDAIKLSLLLQQNWSGDSWFRWATKCLRIAWSALEARLLPLSVNRSHHALTAFSMHVII
jgi:hypothetical protein